ncbi:hypothetical protein V6N13_040154 [Hibiscus sabdariffa]
MGALEDVIAKGNRLILDCKRSFEKQVVNIRTRQFHGCWKRPRSGWLKVNVDVAVSTADSSTGLGTVVRDDRGEWVIGTSRFIGRCSILRAELWAILEGLLYAWSQGYRYVELESDSLEAVHLVLSTSPDEMVCGLVLSIKDCLRKIGHVRIQHVYREGNRVADRLATMGRMQRGLRVTLTEVPVELRELIEAEKSQSAEAETVSTEEEAFTFDPGGV